MIKIEHVKGKNKGKIMLYALSTCVWCRKTKELLKDLGVEYYYIFVDQLEDADREQQMGELSKYNPYRSFPTLVINNDKCIVGFKEDEIREALGK
jgi:glutaredoxin